MLRGPISGPFSLRSERKFLSTFTPAAASALPGPEWLRARRAAAAERFEAGALPTEAEEIWRYSRISDLDLDAFAPAGDAEWASPADAPAIPVPLQPVIRAVGRHAGVIVVVNGRVTHVAVDPELAAKGLFVGDVADLSDGDDVFGAVAVASTDAFTELNAAFAPGAGVVSVPAGLTVEAPIVILHWTDGHAGRPLRSGHAGQPLRSGHAGPVATFPRTIVHAGADSDVTIVEHQASSVVNAFVDPVVELDVGDAARLRYLNVQDLGPQVWQVGYQASRVGRDATLQSSVVALGGDYARVRTDSQIVGKGGTSYLNAVFFADGARMHDFRTVQDHVGPSSTSDLLFKGAVQDRARSVYSGLIRVRKEARGTNAFQTNRNLVLSEGASAESVPNLEIETNDVRCSHASAVGPIDEDQLYYLETRGVPPDAAERLIVLGFFSEVLDKLPIPTLVGSIRSSVAERLRHT